MVLNLKTTFLSTLVMEKGSQNFSSPYTPEQNGVAERKNKTLIEAARTMLSGSVIGCPVYIHNHKYYLGKFDEKSNDGYFLGYSLVSKAFRVFNTIRQQTDETYHITFDESTDAIKFTNLQMTTSPLLNLKDTYLISIFIHMNHLKDVSSDQHYQADQNDHSAQDDEILNDDQSEHSNHNNDNHIIDNLPNTKDV
ncbi:retrovirus-related pol polyprotein from transposon TNT 1-94 [Tanacetum coccineum]